MSTTFFPGSTVEIAAVFANSAGAATDLDAAPTLYYRGPTGDPQTATTTKTATGTYTGTFVPDVAGTWRYRFEGERASAPQVTEGQLFVSQTAFPDEV